MAFDLRKFLSDKDKYPDTAKVTLADGVETTLGDLRAFQDEQDEGIRGRMGELDQREQVLGRAADEVGRARAAIEEMRNNPAAAAENPELKQLLELFQGIRGGKKVSVFEEPGDYFKPLVDRLDSLSTEIKGAQESHRKMQKDLQDTLAWDLKNRVKVEYRQFKDWPKEYDNWQKVYEFAKGNRLLDENNYPDFDAVHERVTAPIRQKGELEAERKRIRDEERESARKEAGERTRRDTFVPMPNSSPGGGVGKAKSYGGIEKVAEGDILNDPDMPWNQIN